MEHLPHDPAAVPMPDDDTPPYPAPESYDPEAYRWVPVRLQPRYDGWTEEKQRRFIEALADTGIVALAAKAVGMTRESAYRLRRAEHAEAFSRAWDSARNHAGSLLEDVAFERAIEGVEHNVYDEDGEVVCTKRVYNDRLLTFLLRHLKPERYARDAPARPDPASQLSVDACLRDMEPALPAPPEQLLDPETLAVELQMADISDGAMPHYLLEQRTPKSEARLRAEALAAQVKRGKAVIERINAPGPTDLTRQDMVDLCRSIDPTGPVERSRKRFR